MRTGARIWARIWARVRARIWARVRVRIRHTTRLSSEDKAHVKVLHRGGQAVGRVGVGD